VVAATGAYDAEGKTFPMVVFVNKVNPLSQLTLAQVDAVFGAEHKLGAGKNLRKWGDLGLTGEWANKPIHVYGYFNDSGFGVFFSQAAMGGSNRWNCDIHQFDNITGADGKVTAQGGRRSLTALAADKYGIAYSGIRYATSDVKALGLAVKDGGPYIAPTKANVANRAYPLIRDIPIYFNRPPGKDIQPKVREFLLYILSREGQEDVAREGDFLPLTAEMVIAGRRTIQ